MVKTSNCHAQAESKTTSQTWINFCHQDSIQAHFFFDETTLHPHCHVCATVIPLKFSSIHLQIIQESEGECGGGLQKRKASFQSPYRCNPAVPLPPPPTPQTLFLPRNCMIFYKQIIMCILPLNTSWKKLKWKKKQQQQKINVCC